MMLPRSLIAPMIAAAAALFASAGCGGETFEGSGSGARGGTSGAGGSGGNAGTGGTGGGSAGTGSGGGSGTGAGGGAGTGSGGAAGAAGSGGLPPDLLACGETSECAVREAACCQGCGPHDLGNAVAYNRKYADQVNVALCGPDPLACPFRTCVVSPSYVLPFCIEGRCQAIDIRQDLLTSCGTDQQCRLRWGTQCCEACGAQTELLVAVNSQVNYEATVCGGGMACPDCAIGSYPPNAVAVCGPDYHCTVGWLAER